MTLDEYIAGLRIGERFGGLELKAAGVELTPEIWGKLSYLARKKHNPIEKVQGVGPGRRVIYARVSET